MPCGAWIALFIAEAEEFATEGHKGNVGDVFKSPCTAVHGNLCLQRKQKRLATEKQGEKKN